MKILFFAPESNVPNKAGHYGYLNLRAPLINLGHEVIDFDYWAETKKHGKEGMNQKLKDLIAQKEKEQR